MTFYLDRINGKLGEEEFQRYLQNQRNNRNLRGTAGDIISYQLTEIRRSLGEAGQDNRAGLNDISEHLEISNRNAALFSQKQSDDFHEFATLFTDNLNDGLEEISRGLGNLDGTMENVNQKIGRLNMLLDWKTDLLIEGQKITNSYLGNVIELLQIPDIQLERAHYVEQGMIYLLSAIEEGASSDHYNVSFNQFEKAISIDGLDYFTLHKLGLIRLNSLLHLDVKAALEKFLTAIRYGIPVYKTTTDKTRGLSKGQIGALLASCYYYASRCCYILGTVDESIDHANRAANMEPGNSEYIVNLAKCLISGNRVQAAYDQLIAVIKKDYYIIIKILRDRDFINSPELIEKLRLFMQEFVDEIAVRVAALKLRSKRESTEIGRAVIGISDQFKKKNYVRARKVEAELGISKPWNYFEYSYAGYGDPPKHTTVKYTGTLEEAVKLEEVQELKLPGLKEEHNEYVRIRNEQDENIRRFEESVEKRKQSHANFLTNIVIGIFIFAIIAIGIKFAYKSYQDNQPQLKAVNESSTAPAYSLFDYGRMNEVKRNQKFRVDLAFGESIQFTFKRNYRNINVDEYGSDLSRIRVLSNKNKVLKIKPYSDNYFAGVNTYYYSFDNDVEMLPILLK